MSAEHGSPLSQDTKNFLNVFNYPSGQSIPIFVEASSIKNRPKLIRLLRNSGATISHDPAHAHIILVDPNTDPGRQFIRDWGVDPIKIVLQHTWVNRCVQAGRALLQNDIWGDCVAIDDGESIKVEAGEEIVNNPLPTPRPTPSDPEPSSKIHSHSEISSKPNREARANDIQSHNYDYFSNQSVPRISESPRSQNFPQSQQVVHAQHLPPFSPPQQAQQPEQYSQYPQQHSQQFVQSQHLPQQQFPQSQSLAFSNPFTQSSTQMQPLSQMQSGQGASYSSTMMPNIMGTPNGSVDPQMLLANLMDVLRQYNVQMPMGMPQVQQTLNNMTQQMHQPQSFQSNGLLSSAQEPSTSSSFPGPSYNAAKASTPTPTPTPTPSPPSPPKRSKGKARAMSARRNSLKRAHSPSYEEIDFEIPTTPTRKLSTITPHVVFPRKPGAIFKADSGNPLLFFVQVDLYGRHGMVQNIKKNGGKMSGSITDANYVILGNSQSKTYQDLLSQATAANKLPLRSTFIADCVQHEGLLDQNDYVLEDYAPPKKRPRTSTAAPVKEEKPKVKKEKVERTQKQSVDSIPHDGPPSPSPVPVKDDVNYIGGNYRFTIEEVNYFKRYARCLIERDLKVANTTIMKKMHAKMPHHSANSWYNYFSRNLPSELNDMRKKIGIVKRKALDAENNPRAKQLQQASNNEAGPSKRPSLESTAADGDPQLMDTTLVQNLAEQDYHDICQFFATGGGDNGDDEQVWAALEARQRCRSAPSWPEFYKSREEDIANEVRRLFDGELAANQQKQENIPQPNGNQ